MAVGDSLWGIARRHDVTVEALLVANPQIAGPRLLRVGDEVTISPIDLGTLKGRRSGASDINERGEIVGTSETELGPPWDPTFDVTPDYEAHAFLWKDGVMRDLGSVGQRSSWATSINERGEVVGGLTKLNDPGEQAFLWRAGAMTIIEPRLAPGTRPSINDAGQIALTTEEPDPDPALTGSRVLLWESGHTSALGSLASGANAEAADVNNRGQVVGWVGTASGARHAFLWSDGIVTDLGTLGGEDSEATAINDRGQIVGWSDTKSRGARAFLWSDGVMTDLGTLAGGWASYASDVNERGQIVGSSNARSGGTHAFLWQEGAMRDLGTLARAPDPRHLESPSVGAAAINDCGWVVGSDYQSSVVEGHALLWFAPSK